MRKSLLLVFVHGFKGSDTTFKQYPYDLQKLVQRELPRIEVVAAQYPQFETRGDLLACIVRFREWLHDKVMSLEAKNDAPSPVLDPSVHVILIGHSMGGIVAAETLLSITGDKAAMSVRSPPSSKPATPLERSESRGGLSAPDLGQPTPREYPAAFYPHIRAILALDTPFLGISPSVVAYGAEDGWKKAGETWLAVTQASERMGLTSPASQAQASTTSSTVWSVLGKVAMYTGATAAVATAAGVALWNWKHLSEGMKWVSSHLEFISCLGRGEELKNRLEAVINLSEERGIGFADFYVALGDKMNRVSNYPGSGPGITRTFCFIPQNTSSDITASVGVRRTPSAPPVIPADDPSVPHLADEMKDGDKVENFAKDPSKSKGRWVQCTNEMAGDELTAHRTMFIAPRNPGYFTWLLPQTRDQIVHWIDQRWYESSDYRDDIVEEPRDFNMSDTEDFDLD
ncbi:hypothetical protein AMS68_000879 [Peltaster fructicola]|uniref:AB hydrolase-1 domain-containing protein n=1 Tax=Peltaster fructicola TaxID=286661 RepID=A0A6H0XKU3_9PEZI|nr:hypothetical protein AMS68_000879 [Peltaster fructicola]